MSLQQIQKQLDAINKMISEMKEEEKQEEPEVVFIESKPVVEVKKEVVVEKKPEIVTEKKPEVVVVEVKKEEPKCPISQMSGKCPISQISKCPMSGKIASDFSKCPVMYSGYFDECCISDDIRSDECKNCESLMIICTLLFLILMFTILKNALKTLVFE